MSFAGEASPSTSMSISVSDVLSYPLHSSFSIVTDYATRHEYPFTFKEPFYCIFGSCDGMFCLEVNRSVILWNPSIQKSKTLPSIGGFPPVTAYGIGFDTLIDNYKVVCVVDEGILEDAKIKVHTLGTNSWRMIPGDFPVPTRRSLKLASGTLNWFSFDDYRIVSFDLVNESCRKLLPPTYYGEVVYSVILDVLRDCLCIFAHSYTSSTVWMMKEYGNEESWTQLFRVPRREESFYDIHTRPIWISKDDLVLMKKKMNLAICDFKNGAFKIQMIQNIDDWLSPEVYIESLVSPCF
ncbi:F-box/kelch-repeat protein At3g23880-like isoform X2 [Vicia villosa]|uniref:F-box/kelch-repeat protein At3g23880-like isoform X2 n=1 Tax=Vicia villosa TaxID=3911 RepID=UPI00273C9653|nr:F-box/kelch-repeat protein At3g23880-like isoform X2 [Vicia villosa]